MAYGLDDSWDNCTRVARAGNACFGLYVRCGIWVARNLTDGFVPGEIAAGYGSPEQARKLVDVGLWDAVEGGYQMPDYLDRNPTAEKVRERQRADAERKAKWRARRGGRRPSAGSHGGTDGRTPDSPAAPKGAGARGALHAVPDWCRRCHPDTRMYVDAADQSVPCSTCHPDRGAA
jgi:hypothetical protein